MLGAEIPWKMRIGQPTLNWQTQKMAQVTDKEEHTKCMNKVRQQSCMMSRVISRNYLSI